MNQTNTVETTHKKTTKKMRKQKKQLHLKWRILIYVSLLLLLLMTIVKVPYFTSVIDYVIEYFFGFSRYLIYFILLLLALFWWSKKLRCKIFNRFTIWFYVLSPILLSIFLGYISNLVLKQTDYIFLDGSYTQIFTNLWKVNFIVAISHTQYYFSLFDFAFGGVSGFINLDLYTQYVVIFMVVLLSFILSILLIIFILYSVRNKRWFYNAKLRMINKLIKNVNKEYKKEFELVDHSVNVSENAETQEPVNEQPDINIQETRETTPLVAPVVTADNNYSDETRNKEVDEQPVNHTSTRTGTPSVMDTHPKLTQQNQMSTSWKSGQTINIPQAFDIGVTKAADHQEDLLTPKLADSTAVKSVNHSSEKTLTNQTPSTFKRTQKFTLSMNDIFEEQKKLQDEKVVFDGEQDYYHELNNMINKIDFRFNQYAKANGIEVKIITKRTYFSMAEVVYSLKNIDIPTFISQHNLELIQILTAQETDLRVNLYQQNKDLALQVSSTKLTSSFSLKNEIKLLDEQEWENFNLIYGKDHEREVVWSNQLDGNLIVYGSAKGSGRAMLLSNIIMGCLLTHKSSEIELYLFDAKTKLTKTFTNLIHTRKITDTSDPAEVIEDLRSLQLKFNDIKKTMQNKGVDNLFELNHMSQQAYKMSLIVFSEFAHILDSPYKEKFIVLLQNLIALAPSIGCLIVLGTEIVNEQTSAFKGMFENIAILKLNNEYESTLISPHNWLHNLYGSGDLVLMKANTIELLRLQIAKITNEEISSLLQKLSVDN
ncbi:FtsK/SpoIIIE domain-containing protein [Ureaplasma zalophigenitalium]|uniref:FtsK/SpoIIIE domain-containing protein n=1 Tax=Ureaplasma zalophigenitalium TaxID=907723 RepID=A0ABT3BNV4_9BACT|nr:FtsK/SpoIIIE domain-containing protein [Ureaplasma zalophigenitalium]MCV3753910.1 FtsK/SpoIIIE domain-containing protein [Ureaplasma zalophigenitalium]